MNPTEQEVKPPVIEAELEGDIADSVLSALDKETPPAKPAPAAPKTDLEPGDLAAPAAPKTDLNPETWRPRHQSPPSPPSPPSRRSPRTTWTRCPRTSWRPPRPRRMSSGCRPTC